jgi:aspartate/methionine/tyrosine aminotransferase
LREAIAKMENKLYNLDSIPDDIRIWNGVSGCLDALFFAMIDPKRKRKYIMVPKPGYFLYYSLIKAFGGGVIPFNNVEEDKWYPDVDDFRKKIKDDRVGYAILNYPNNPTGSVTPRSIMTELVDIVGEYGKVIISDEIYRNIKWVRNGYDSVSELGRGISKVILGGLAKEDCGPGLKLGWMIKIDSNNELTEVWEGCDNWLRAHLGANTLVQKAYAAVLQDPQCIKDHVEKMNRELEPRAKLVYELGNEIGLSLNMPEGAFYWFPRYNLKKKVPPEQFCRKLLYKEHICVAPGEKFGGESNFRVTLLRPKDILKKDLLKIGNFISEYN